MNVKLDEFSSDTILREPLIIALFPHKKVIFLSIENQWSLLL